MKKMMTMLVKMAAKFVIGYLPDVAIWAIQYGADKAKDDEKAAYVLSVVKRIATEAALVARIMEDGVVSAQEESEVRTATMDLAEQIEDLI